MNPIIAATSGSVVIYQSSSENIQASVLYKDETFWMTQKDLANLFSVKQPTISKHLRNIFNEGELDEKAVYSKMEYTATDGKTYDTGFYNLDAIIAVGYRVNSKEATQFRIWATNTLREYIIKGFVLNDDMLKNGRPFGQDYFKELLRRVRAIRASERRIYQQITDIFAECSIDYDPNSSVTRGFYATVQNKFHYAITGHTAAEIIHGKADSQKEHMGLTTWDAAPDGRVYKKDALIAKNYLTEDQIQKLERAVSSFFDYIERIIENHETFTMQAFAASVDKFLSFNEYKILTNKGKISMQAASKKALQEYAKFNKHQKFLSDFDKSLKKGNTHD